MRAAHKAVAEVEARPLAVAVVEDGAGVGAEDRTNNNRNRNRSPLRIVAASVTSRLILQRRRKDVPTGSKKRFPCLPTTQYLQ